MDGLKIRNIGGLDCYEENGVAYLNLEQAARGLGFTQTAASGNVVVRWERVRRYLADFGVPTSGDDGFIPENIFYRLAMKAKSEAAERFQAWVADEVIPAIRKTGGYIAGAEKMTDAEIMAQAVLVANRTIEARDARIRELEAKAQADAPFVIFAGAVSVSKDAILIGELAKILKQNGVPDMGQNRLFERLRKEHYLISRKGTDYNMPTQKSMELGLFAIKENTIAHSDGHTTISKTVKVTGKGQIYFVNHFLRKDAAPVAEGAT